MDLARELDPQNLLTHYFARPEDADKLARAGSKLRVTGEIPRVIHQIWLGSPLPARLAKFRETWRRANPEWDFRLWTDREVEAAGFECADLLSRTRCFGQKSDLLRAEIVHRFGGLYIDLDYECYAPIARHVRGDLMAVLRWIPQAHLGWPALFPQPLIVCNSLFGATAGHPLLGEYLTTVRESWDSREFSYTQGELDAISLRVLGGLERVSRLKETALRTYLPFHRLVWRESESIALEPPSRFNPVIPGWPGLYAMPGFWRRYQDSKAFPRFWEYSGVGQETTARHWSAASWL